MFEKTLQTKETANENGTFQFQFFNQSEISNESVSSLFANRNDFQLIVFSFRFTPGPFPPAKPISNDKSKVFLGNPDESSNEDDDEQEKSAQLDE